jgi:hypothetical protein
MALFCSPMLITYTTNSTKGGNCGALSSCELCLPYTSCGWCASLSRCLSADPFSPERRAASTRCFAPAWMHGVDIGAVCPTAHCHSLRDEHSCTHEAHQPDCGWCTQSGLCLPRWANASCASGWDAPNADAAWVPVTPRIPPRRPPCRSVQQEEERAVVPPQDAPAVEPLEPPPDIMETPCLLPRDVAARDVGIPTSREVLRAGNAALAAEVAQTVHRPQQARRPPPPPPLPEWGGAMDDAAANSLTARLMEARRRPAVV